MTRFLAKRVLIDAPPRAVWRALTDAQELVRWFPPDARVSPGTGGSISLSWGDGAEASAPITVWEPEHWLQWKEPDEAAPLTVDFRLEEHAGCTSVRLIESGFGVGAEWDAEYDRTSGNWSYFLQHLKRYLEHHHGVPRQMSAWRETVDMEPAEAFEALLGPAGLSASGDLAERAAGDPYRITTSQGDALTGIVIARCDKSQQIGLTLAELGGALLFLEVEPDPEGCRPGLWLSTYGHDPQDLAAVDQRFARLYRIALGISRA